MLGIKKSTIDNIIAIVPVALMVVLVNSDFTISLNVKADTFLLVLGNFTVAIYIASVLNKEHKKNELKIENCFKELLSLEKLIDSLRTLDDIPLQDDYALNRYTSLIRLQISLISKYPFVNEEDIKKLDDYMSSLDEELTGKEVINQNYKNTIVQFEKRILVIKSNIL